MKAISLISGGIDSPVASWMIKKKGVEIVYLHMNTNKKHIENVRKLVRIIDKNAKLVIKDFIPALKNIKDQTNSRLTCILCKRTMYREAQRLAKKVGADFIITGENLGQVASQTLENMAVLDKAVNIPVIRPLLSFDKNETTEIAKKIGTYNVSKLDTGVCSFLPRKPVTRVKLEFVEKEEKRLMGLQGFEP